MDEKIKIPTIKTRKIRIPTITIILVLCIMVSVLIRLSSCSSIGLVSGTNKELADLTYKFDYAYIRLTDDVIVQGNVQSWLDYDDSDMVQVTIDSKTYYTHGSNIVLVAEKTK